MLHQHDSRDPIGALTEQLNQASDDRQSAADVVVQRGIVYEMPKAWYRDSGLPYQNKGEIFPSCIVFLTTREMQQEKGA